MLLDGIHAPLDSSGGRRRRRGRRSLDRCILSRVQSILSRHQDCLLGKYILFCVDDLVGIRRSNIVDVEACIWRIAKTRGGREGV